MIKKDKLYIILILLTAGFLRFYNLLHDSPYFFNPDERNMAIATSRFRLPSQPSQIPICLINQISQIFTHNQQLTTDNCSLNPHFFAYGQFPLYLAYFSDQTLKFVASKILSIVSILQSINNLPRLNRGQQLTISNYLSTPFPSAVFWLRFYSALASTLTVLLTYLITKELIKKSQASRTKFQTSTKHQEPNFKQKVLNFEFRNWNLSGIWDLGFEHLAALMAAFTPGLIQSAHFGTTESLLAFFFMASVYLSLKLLPLLSRLSNLRNPKGLSSIFYLLSSIFLLSLVIGLALGAKFTGLFFLTPPLIALMIQIVRVLNKRRKNWLALLGYFLIGLLIFFGSILFYLLSSPYNFIELESFKSAVFGYEADVATGKYEAFYTRQFVDTAPILFQVEKIFPYVLGWPIFILGTLGFLLITLNLLLSVFLSIIKQNQKSTFVPSSGRGKIKNQKYIEKIKKKWRIFAQQNKIFVDCIPNRVPRLWIVERLITAVRDLWTIPSRSLDALQARKFCLRAKIDNKQDLFIIISFSFLIYLIPNSFLFAKWTRFMTPVFPFFAIFAGYFLAQISSRTKNWPRKLQIANYKLLGYWVIGLLVFISMLPGAAFMSIYIHEDVRVAASRWIWHNIPDKSYLLFETANVIDIPLGIPEEKLPEKNYTLISFDFYHLDENREISESLFTHLEKANYIFIPSRRIFANYLRLPQRYPLITKYYQLLYSGALGFEKIAEFTSFPQLTINHYSLVIPDEEAEESFTVFDHPVIRIYRKVKPLTKEGYKSLFEK